MLKLVPGDAVVTLSTSVDFIMVMVPSVAWGGSVGGPVLLDFVVGMTADVVM